MTVRVMKMEDLLAEWEADSRQLDMDNPTLVLQRIPLLHGKWWQWLVSTEYSLSAVQTELSQMRRDKLKYYRGQMSMEETTALGWPPQPLKLVAKDAEFYRDADPEVTRLREREDRLKARKAFLSDVVKMIHAIGYHVRTHVDWLRFSQGSG